MGPRVLPTSDEVFSRDGLPWHYVEVLRDDVSGRPYLGLV